MKKLILFIVAILYCSNLIFAQEQENTPIMSDKNEVSLNLPIAIFASFPEVSYERVLAEDMGVGASVAFSLDDTRMADLKFLFTPYARWYFGGSRESAQKYAAGFFVEANSAVVVKQEVETLEFIGGSSTYTKKEKNKTGFGLGVAIGWKFVTRSNWIGQIYIGGGRDFTNNGGYPRFGICIGKRF